MNFLNPTRFIIILSLLVLAGCSALTEFRSEMSDKIFGREPANPPAQLQEFNPTYTAKIDWSSNIGATERYDYTPVLDSNAVYAANAEGEITKLDAANGNQLWRVNIGEPISGGVGIGTGVVLVGSKRGYVHAYDTAGKALWKAKVSSEILSAPRYFDGLVIARTGDNRIFGLDAADGTRKWVYERITPALSLRSSAGVVVDGGAVYAGFAGGKLVAVRADNGKLLWEATVAQPKGVTEIERIADITSLPFVDGPLVYAVAYQGRIAAVDRRSGKVVWNRDISSYTGLSAEEGKVYVSHALGSVYSLDFEQGKSFWRQAGLLNRRVSAPLPMGSVVAVGDLEGYLHFLARDDGSFAARIKLDGNAVMSIVAGSKSNQLIVETRDGGLYAVSISDNGAKQDSRPTAAPAKRSEPEAPTTEPAAPSEERSIMFQKNDSILLPDVEQKSGSENSAPGISLPSAEPQ